jgi:hypothetical protein
VAAESRDPRMDFKKVFENVNRRQLYEGQVQCHLRLNPMCIHNTKLFVFCTGTDLTCRQNSGCCVMMGSLAPGMA